MANNNGNDAHLNLERDAYFLSIREEVKKTILDDRANDAMQLMENAFPGLLDNNEELKLSLKQLYFDKLHRTRQYKEAKELAPEIAAIYNVSPPYDNKDGLMALLSRPKPEEGTELEPFYPQQYRVELAKTADSVIWLETIRISLQNNTLN